MVNILYYYADDGSNMYAWQHLHIIDELAHHNVSVEIFNPLKYESYEQANEHLLIHLRKNRYDLFMNSCKSERLFVETLVEIKKLSIPTLLFCPDNLHAPHQHKKIMPYFDLVWLTSLETEKMIQGWGATTIFLPYAANPHRFHPVRTNQQISKVCFIGTPYGTRTIKINELTAQNIPVDAFFGKTEGVQNASSSFLQGGGFSYSALVESLTFPIGRKVLLGRILAAFNKCELDVHAEAFRHYPSLSFDDMMRVYSEYALSLNVTELRNTYLLSTPVHKLHLRSFEIPMCGGVQFTTFIPELGQYFKEDKEIVFYRCKEEYIDKAKFYLRKDNQTTVERIKQAARLRAESEHTWWHRFERIFERLGITL